MPAAITAEPMAMICAIAAIRAGRATIAVPTAGETAWTGVVLPVTLHGDMPKADRITDFQPGIHKIDLSHIDANPLVAGDQAFSPGQTGASIMLDGHVALTASDFTL